MTRARRRHHRPARRSPTSLGQHLRTPPPPLAIQQVASLGARARPIATARHRPHASSSDGLQRPTLSYRLQTGKPARVTVTVVKQATGRVVKTLRRGPGAPRHGPGRRLERQPPGPLRVRRLRDGRERELRHHGPGTGADRLPAARPQVPHPRPSTTTATASAPAAATRAQDVFAKCGTPLVAARGGTVKIAKFQSRRRQLHRHRRRPDRHRLHVRAPARSGARRAAASASTPASAIGYVGDTGSASGCHLHFEMWSAPGWYTGGSPFDPVADLRSWDAYS